LENLKIVYVYSSSQASLKDVSVGVEGSPNLWYNSIWENYYWINYYQNLPSVSGLNSNEIILSENQSITVGSFVFQNLDPLSGQNGTVQMVFWYESLPIHNVYSTTQPKAVMISVFAPVNQGESVSLVKKQLIDLAISIAENINLTVKSIAPLSLLEIIISQDGAQLSLVTGVLLIVTLFLYRLEAKKMRKASERAYLKLFKSDLQLISTIDRINKDGLATLEAISAELNNVRGQLDDENKLMQEIMELEKTGLIKRSLANKQDEPIQIWKT
jgi:hypothetical protein